MRTESFGGSATLRLVAVLVVAAFTVTACRTATSETAAPDGSTEVPAQAAATTPVESDAPADKTMCQSGADLSVDVAFLRSLDLSEDGVASLVVGADAALGEARLLADLVVDEYRPLVEDTVVALQGLRDVGEQAGEQETIGAGIATIGEAITEVGEAMDALAMGLREPCPQEVS